MSNIFLGSNITRQVDVSVCCHLADTQLCNFLLICLVDGGCDTWLHGLINPANKLAAGSSGDWERPIATSALFGCFPCKAMDQPVTVHLFITVMMSLLLLCAGTVATSVMCSTPFHHGEYIQQWGQNTHTYKPMHTFTSCGPMKAMSAWKQTLDLVSFS